LQRFPPQSWLANSQTPNSSDSVLRDDNQSWSSLQINQTKKQRASGNTTNNPKQPNSTYYSVGPTNGTMVDVSLMPAQRRRAQNRASQRAFRERKERHVKNLEQQLEDLHQQYEELLRGYDQQKAEIFQFKAELEDLRSEKESLQVPHNSPLEFSETVRSQSYQGEDITSHLRENELPRLHSRSLTPAPNPENQNFASQASMSEGPSPFAALLPLTPSENFENSAILRPSGPLFAFGEASRCYGVSDHPDRQQHQQQDEFDLSGFSKEFPIIPSADIFEGWR
jgi:bZIP transcription factor